MIQVKTTFAVNFGTGVVVMRNAPATVCSQCGMEWIDDNTAAQTETIVKEAKNRHSMVEVLSLRVNMSI